ncbi:MAG TPA: tetratricopeptide repeat protein, partial [Candidatus Eremiobacteraceae bacterium]|nr:tetratricopeptide repeat protein [Candidatus Eremiobacteraceae bacterium]
AGGVGKTRLALQVGADLLDRYEDGVWLVELAPIADKELVPSAVASVFHVLDAPNRTMTEAIVHALKSRRALIVFDNCEHVVESAARIIDAILRNCPHIRIIATTRQGLGIAGEAVHRVASLAVPEANRELTAEEAARHGAVALFVERATAATESFRLTDENASIVAQLCQRLDGIALAIELAAPRLKVLSLEQLDAKLSERFRILTGGSRTALPRQQTMRALVDWSYDLLTDDEKTLFRRTAVFSGGWSLDAACAICSDEKIEEWTVLDLLQSLVDKSMVVAKLSGSEQRYRLLESTRQYARELLEKSGELEPMQVKHAKWFLEFAERAEAVRISSPTKTWLAMVEPENDNLRAALDWALGEKRDVELGCKIASRLASYWNASSNEAEGKARIEAAMACLDGIASKRIIADLWLAKLQITTVGAVSWNSMRQMAEHVLELMRELGDEAGMGFALNQIGETYLRQFEHAKASQYLDESLRLAEKVGIRTRIGAVKGSMARNAHFAGKTDEARVFYAEALSIARAIGNDRLRINVLGNLGEIEFSLGNAERALELGRETLSIPGTGYIALNNLAEYLAYLGQFDEARSTARKALQVARDAQVSAHTAISIQVLAHVAMVNRDGRLAARLFGYSDATFRRMEVALEPTETTIRDAVLAGLQSALRPDELSRMINEGAALSEDQAVEEALRV